MSAIGFLFCCSFVICIHAEFVKDGTGELLRQYNERLASLENRVLSLEREKMAMEENYGSLLKVCQQKGETIPQDKYRRLLQVVPPTTTSSSAVAFYAYLSHSQSHLGTHHILTFDTVPTNLGGGYEPNTGTFSAPESGTYVFSWSGIISYTGHIGLDLIINGKVFGNSYPSSNDAHWGSATGLAVAELQAGDLVQIRTTVFETPYGTVISDKYRKTSFSGWRV